MEEKEIWKDVVGYEGFYQVSNLGRIRSLPNLDAKQKFNYREYYKILTPFLEKSGYLRVQLTRGNRKRVLLHRLVAEAFVPNPNNYPIVNHKDENTTNNRADNLEFCTVKYNSSYGTANERRYNSYKEKHGRPVNMYDLNGNFIKRYDCLRSVSKDGFYPSNVRFCCEGIYHKSGGFKWKYANK